MPSNIGPIAGNEGKLYYNTTLASTFTTSGSVLVAEAIDVNCAMSHGTADAKSRASIWGGKLPTIGEIMCSFGYLYNSDPNDTVFTALYGAFMARTVWHWAVMDNVLSSPGAKGSNGPTFPGVITKFDLGQPLEGGVQYDVEVSFVRVKSSGSLVVPSYLVVAPT